MHKNISQTTPSSLFRRFPIEALNLPQFRSREGLVRN
jgi:hypothetical protein